MTKTGLSVQQALWGSCSSQISSSLTYRRETGCTDFAGYAEDALARYKDDINRGATSKKKRKRIMWETTAAGLFDQVVADEGHMLKTISTRVHQSVARLQARPF